MGAPPTKPNPGYALESDQDGSEENTDVDNSDEDNSDGGNSDEDHGPSCDCLSRYVARSRWAHLF